VDTKIAAPRLANPRTSVPSGSVGIAGEQTGIYPMASPGGWNIIGRTPVKLFDTQRPNPVLLNPGDAVNFTPISRDRFESFDSSQSPIFEHEYLDR
jgi:inhibitor of KinA